MKKNGFTLVELLAVILIIGLIFLLAVTNVIPIFRKSKTKGFINDAVTLAEAARIKYKDDILNNIDDDLFAGNMAGKKCYSIQDNLIGTYASDLNTNLVGSVEVCFGTSCTYETKVWLTNGDMYIDGSIIDENNNSTSLIKESFTSTNTSTCGVDLVTSNIMYTFNATGAIQSLTIPETGTYKLEVWGAQGGNANKIRGGYGGYSVGTISLNQGSVLYIGVGKQGSSGLCNAARPGGYNGGGSVPNANQVNRYVAGGGGATHIALNSNRGTLSNYSSNQSEVLIVAGGGGGGYYHNASTTTNKYYGEGGDAGGYIGENGEGLKTNNLYGLGGSQTQGGCAYNTNNLQCGGFGYGGDCGSGVHGSAGGAGWYGGGGSSGVSGTANSSGAGGSGYIGNSNLTNKAMYCYNCHEALNLPIDEGVYTVSTTGTSKFRNTSTCSEGYSSKAISKCAKENDGFVRITHVS